MSILNRVSAVAFSVAVILTSASMSFARSDREPKDPLTSTAMPVLIAAPVSDSMVKDPSHAMGTSLIQLLRDRGVSRDGN